MIEKCDEAEFDSQLRQALGTAPRPDFEDWRSAHQDSLAELGNNSKVVNSMPVRRWSRRRMASLSLALAASFLVAMFLWPFSDNSCRLQPRKIDGSYDQRRGHAGLFANRCRIPRRTFVRND